MRSIVACFPNSYGRFGPRGGIPLLREAGITHVEMPIRTAGVPSFFGEDPLLTDRSGAGDIAAVRQLLDEHELTACSCNVTSGNPLDAEVVAVTKRKLDVAAALAVPLVVAGAGEVESTEQLPELHAHLREIGDHAARLGITYCFETHPGLCQNWEGMLATMQSLDHDHLRLNFDTGNLFYYNRDVDLESSLRQVGAWVRHVHLKDTNGKYRDWHFPALGSGGAVDFRRVRDVLSESRFAGPFSLEIEGIEGEPPLTLEQHQQRIVESVEHLRACGYFD
jgi:inosose dehydratase